MRIFFLLANIQTWIIGNVNELLHNATLRYFTMTQNVFSIYMNCFDPKNIKMSQTKSKLHETNMQCKSYNAWYQHYTAFLEMIVQSRCFQNEI